MSSKDEIERLLRLGLAPITDNVAALRELGFERSYPGATSGYDSTLWERSREYGDCPTSREVRRVLARERAFLERG
ncbi:MAG: hypothetical protein ACREM2_03380 [Vulcanimicrobiaceae bacterium]